MKRVMVYAPASNFMKEPSFRLRLAALAEPLKRRGYELDLRPRPGTPIRRWLFARSARRYHAVILHRKWLDPFEARALRNAAGAGKIIMDIDDATMYHETELSPLARARLERRFEATCGILDLACAGNEYLAQIFRDRGLQARVIPTVVDPDRYAVKRHGAAGAGTEVRLVWLGSKSTLKYLEEYLPAFASACAQMPTLKLVVICDLPPRILSEVPLEFVQWTLDGEAPALLKGDIGIAPTPENRWTLGKCGFKIVQYMAAGLPVIASPVGANVDLARPGMGMLARTPEEWAAAIGALARDASLRMRLGQAARERVERELNVEAAADAWAEVLE